MSKYYTKTPRPVKLSFGKRPHRGALEKSLKEKIKISKKEFEELLPYYNYYCFDERVNQILFLAEDMEKAVYTWLFIQIEQK